MHYWHQVLTPDLEMLAQADNQWPGDDDLSALIGEETNNASTIEFDFVPISNNLSFRFIMASEEYDQGYLNVFIQMYLHFY